jgi:hypothetical protein
MDDARLDEARLDTERLDTALHGTSGHALRTGGALAPLNANAELEV